MLGSREKKILTDGAVGATGTPEPPTSGRMVFSGFFASPKGFVRIVIVISPTVSFLVPSDR